MSSARLHQIKQAYAGQMSEGETSFCEAMRAVISAALQGSIPFQTAMETLLSDLRELRKHGFDVDAATAAGFDSQTRNLLSLISKSGTPVQIPSQDRADFLKDLDGYLAFAIRNGLSFTFVLTGLMHDIGGLANYGWDLQRAEADVWMPKTSGWAARNATPVGESED